MSKKLAVGFQEFREMRTGGYSYVDKTAFIDEWLETGAKVTLITRPRRFGKSLLLDAVGEFFDVTKDSSAIFEGLDVMDGPNAHRINTQPVLNFSFKDCEGGVETITTSMARAIRGEFERYQFIRSGLSEMESALYDEAYSALKENRNRHASMQQSIQTLSNLVSLYYKGASGLERKVLILIDEYDSPIMSAYENGCYGELQGFFKNLFSSALKGNKWMDKAILTGVQRIAKEGVLSGLSNLDVCTVANAMYSEHFGFTETQTRQLLGENGLELDERVRQMYNGYRFGDSRLYNPWAIVNYARTGKILGYWTGTAGDGMLVEKMRVASQEFIDALDEILSMGSAQVEANLETAVFEDNSDSAAWGLFVNAGYLTFTDVPDPEGELFTLCIPNGEVRKALLRVIKKYYGLDSCNAMLHLFRPLLENRDTGAFARRYMNLVLKSASHHDKREYAYCMLMLGMCLSLDSYEVTSNREAGHGRHDILLKPKSTVKGRFAVIIEYKQGEDTDSLAKDAVAQIKEREYTAELEGEILLIGIAHDGKRCSLEFEWTNN